MGALLNENNVGGACFAIIHLSARLCGDWDVMYGFVLRSGMTIKYASERLQDDKQLALIAVEDNWLSLQYLSTRLRNDRELVLLAILQDDRVFDLEYAVALDGKTPYMGKSWYVRGYSFHDVLVCLLLADN